MSYRRSKKLFIPIGALHGSVSAGLLLHGNNLCSHERSAEDVMLMASFLRLASPSCALPNCRVVLVSHEAVQNLKVLVDGASHPPAKIFFALHYLLNKCERYIQKSVL